MAIERFLDGVNIVSEANPLGMLPYPDPTRWSVFMEDFILVPELTSQWTHNNTGGTLSSTSTGGAGSWVQTLAAGDNNYSQVYPKAGTFALTSAKKAIFEAKVMVTAAGTIGLQELFVGLGTLQATDNFIAADGATMTVDACVGFWSGPTVATISAVVRSADVQSTVAAVTSYATATQMVLSWYFDGTSVTFYKNDTQIATISAFPTTAMVPTLWIKCGEAQVVSLTTDYIFVAVER